MGDYTMLSLMEGGMSSQHRQISKHAYLCIRVRMIAGVAYDAKYTLVGTSAPGVCDFFLPLLWLGMALFLIS